MIHSEKSNKIIVMFIIDFIYGITGGTENQLIKIINNLDDKKYDIHLLSLRRTSWIKESRSNLKCKIMTYNIIKLKNPLNLYKFFLIVRTIKNVRPDIVMTLFPLSNIVGVIAARFARVKVIISTRRDYGLWLNKWSVHLLRFANRFVKMIVTNSKMVKRITSIEEKVDTSRINVIYNGLEMKTFKQHPDEVRLLKKKLGILEYTKVVGIVANLNPMKRHRTFIKAAKKALKERTDVGFVVVGDGPLREDLITLAADFGIQDNVYFVGSHDDVLLFLSIFDIGVNCSANEGLSNAIMEYMAYGVPCIAARAGGNPELIENGVNGYTFELDNDRELAEHIINLLDDEKMQKEFASKSKQKIMDQMMLDKMISEYDKCFTQILINTQHCRKIL